MFRPVDKGLSMISDFFCKMFPNEDTRAVMFVLSMIGLTIVTITVCVTIYQMNLLR